MRALLIPFEQPIHDVPGKWFIDPAHHQHHVHVQLGQQGMHDVRARRQRLEMAFRVNALVPRAASAESLGVIIPGAKLLLFPNELIGHAEPAANSALHERGLRAGQCVGNVLG